MPYVTVLYAILLIVLGVGGYFGSGRASFTALIPAAFGLVILIAGLMAMNERYHKHAMHVAAGLGLLGFLGSARGLLGLVSMAMGSAVERPQAVASQTIMAGLSLMFLLLCVQSFVNARRIKKVANELEPESGASSAGTS